MVTLINTVTSLQSQMRTLQGRLDDMSGNGDSLEDNMALMASRSSVTDVFLTNEMMQVNLEGPYELNRWCVEDGNSIELDAKITYLRNPGASTQILLELVKDGQVVAQTFNVPGGSDNSLALFYRETSANEDGAEYQLFIRDEMDQVGFITIPDKNLQFGLKFHGPTYEVQTEMAQTCPEVTPLDIPPQPTEIDD